RPSPRGPRAGSGRSLVLLVVDDLGVHDVLVLGPGLVTGRLLGTGAAGLALLRLCGVEGGAHLLGLLVEGVDLRVEVLGAGLGLRLEGLLEVREGVVDRLALLVGQLLTGLGEELLGGVDEVLAVVDRKSTRLNSSHVSSSY